MRRRPTILALLGASGVAAAALPIMAIGGPGALAPNLRADPVESISQPQVYADTEGGLGDDRLLVRFEGYVTNIGDGPLEIRGNPQPGAPDATRARQYAWKTTEGPGDLPTAAVGDPEVRFESADSHNHFHLMRAMRYSLWNLSKTAQVAPGSKVGFCLYDIEPAPSPSPPPDPKAYDYAVTEFCDQGDPGSTDLRMGVSAGWRDVYDKTLAFQWVDVSNTAPGTYVVGSDADPDGVLWEGGGGSEVNPTAFASTQVIVPGWIAQSVSLPQTGGAQTVPVASTKFGSPPGSSLRYRVVTGPATGTLNVAVGAPFKASDPLVYTPAPGYAGADSFTYAAFSNTSSFPTTPPTATVSLNDVTPSITISGAPTGLIAGTSAQLTATLANLAGGVTWSASAGTITAGGLYVAPQTPPPGGVAVVTAASAVNPAVQSAVTIPIVPAPRLTAAPGVRGELNAGRKRLSRIAVRKVSSRIVVGKVATGPRRGRLVITATIKRQVLGRCVIPRVGARKTISCKLTLKRPYPMTKVRVTARFTDAAGVTAVRRSYVVR